MLQAMLQDLRYALRQLRRSPGFAATAVLTLALGVGANTAIFSLLDQALLRSLPVKEPQRLVILEGTGKAWQGRASSHGGDAESYFSYPMYKDLRDKNTAFEGLIGTSSVTMGLSRDGVAKVVDGEIVSGNYFSVLGVQPVLGRMFTQADDSAPGANSVAVLSYDYWRDVMGSDRSIVGQTIALNSLPFQVIGVAAPGFRSAVWGQTPGIFVPMSMVGQIVPDQAGSLANHRDKWMNIVGRLRDGVSRESAEAQSAPLWYALRADELKALGRRSPKFVDSFLTTSKLRVLPGARGLSYSRDGLEKPLYAVMGMAVLVLLIAAVNVASLLLVRSSARVREFSLRYALGASARRVVGQVLLEGVVIGLLGGGVGAAVAPAAVRVLAGRLTAGNDMSMFATGADSRLMAFNFAVALLVSVLFSLAPTLQLLKPDLVASLKQQVGTSGVAKLGFRRIVVSLQVGLSVLLLVGAGLFVRSLQKLRHVSIGFNPEHLVTFQINPELAGYTAERIPVLYRDVLAALKTIPGVMSVGGTTSPELAGSDSGGNVTVEGYTPPPDEDLDIGRAEVSPDYFVTLQMLIVAGRNFSEGDDAQHPLVAIVNQSFARHYFGSDAAAVGRRMARGGGKDVSYMQIVGVTHDAKHTNLRDDVKMTDYVPLAQTTRVTDITLYLRAASPSAEIFGSVTQVMRQISPGLALNNLRTMDAQIEDSLGNERLIGLLAISFGVLATLLAGIGIYGVLAYSTAQRTREIGIRMALGSSRSNVARLVMSDVLRLAGIGVAVALPCALLLAHVLKSQFYGVSTADPLTIVSVVVLIGLVGFAAALLPARRASNVSPNEALRTE